MSDTKGFATRAIHHAYDPMQNEGALTPPMHLTSTFVFENAEAGGEMFAGEREGHVYSRISNPTCALLEQRIATLEGAEAGVATASGMGAITAVMWTLLTSLTCSRRSWRCSGITAIARSVVMPA